MNWPVQRSVRPGHLVFMAVLGLLGWAILIAATTVSGFGPESMARPDWVAFSMFLVVIVAARTMAVPLLEDSVVSFDAAFYIVAAVCLGSLVAGWLVAVALMVDALLRLVLPGSRHGSERSIDTPIYGLYFGGMSGALLMAVAWFFALDSLYVLAGVADLVVLARVLTVGLVFLVAHYAIQGVRLALIGEPWSVYFRRMALPGILAESTLLPLSAIVVFLYHPEQPLRLALLGTTYLITIYAFNRIATTSSQLRARVSELETLSVTSRRLAASLHIDDLIEALARETLTAIPEAESLTLSRRRPQGAGDLFEVERFERAGGRSRARSAADAGLAGRVVSEAAARYVADRSATAHGGVGSWLGVPMVIHGMVEGVLAVESDQRDAFEPERLRLLEAIGAQGAVALQNARLYDLAMVDGLTTLFVRRYFDARLDEEIKRSERFGTEFSMVLMDIDDFKQLNDTFGHIVGDRVLRAIADVVKSEMRGVDTAARYGGEELAMVLPRTAMVDAYNQAERIRAKIETMPIAADDGGRVTVTASFGIASHPESGAVDAEGLLRLADRALYRAKRTGKNRVELSWSEDDAAAAVLT